MFGISFGFSVEQLQKYFYFFNSLTTKRICFRFHDPKYMYTWQNTVSRNADIQQNCNYRPLSSRTYFQGEFLLNWRSLQGCVAPWSRALFERRTLNQLTHELNGVRIRSQLMFIEFLDNLFLSVQDSCKYMRLCTEIFSGPVDNCPVLAIVSSNRAMIPVRVIQ